jgi:competence protein ComEC
MPNQKRLYFILLFLFIICLILAGIIFSSQKQELTVNFLDVGQGDAILISQGSKQVLIDGGPNGQILLEKLGKYIPFWDRNIEVVIATHPDQDHIDGLIDAMKTYNIGEVIDNSEEADSQVYKKYLETINEKNIPRLKGKSGMNIKISDNAKLEILSPGENLDNNSKDTNADSIVSRLTCGENNFLFMGDFPIEKEPELLELEAKPPIGGLASYKLKSDVLKVAHHGSKYSTGNEFLEKVAPKDAVISVGRNNRYGHPAQELLDRLNAKGIIILRTDERGDIIYKCVDSENLCKLEAR